MRALYAQVDENKRNAKSNVTEFYKMGWRVAGSESQPTGEIFSDVAFQLLPAPPSRRKVLAGVAEHISTVKIRLVATVPGGIVFGPESVIGYAPANDGLAAADH
jgi:hypothetical protein